MRTREIEGATGWTIAVPWANREGNFVDEQAMSYSRSVAIDLAVVLWCFRAGESCPESQRVSLPARAAIVRLDHPHWRRQVWRKLYRLGFRAVRYELRVVTS